MRICDVLFAFPGIFAGIAVVASYGQSGIGNVIIAVAVFSIPAFARLARGNTLVLKQQTFGLRSAPAVCWGQRRQHPVQPYSAGYSIVDCCLFYDAYRRVDNFRRQPVVSGIRGPATDAGVGRAMLNEARADMVIAARGDIPESGDFSDRAGVQPAGGWAARCAGSRIKGRAVNVPGGGQGLTRPTKHERWVFKPGYPTGHTRRRFPLSRE